MRQRHIYAAIQKAHEEKGYPIELACILTAFGSATPRFLSAMCGANRECWTDYVRRSRSLPLRFSWGQDTNAAQPFTAAALSGADPAWNSTGVPVSSGFPTAASCLLTCYCRPAVGWLTLLLWLQWAIEIQDFDREDYIMAGKKTIPAEDPEQPQSAGSMDRTGNPTEKSVRTLRSTVARNCLRPIAYLSNFTLLDNLILLNTQHVTDGIPGHSASDANSGLLPQNLLEDFANCGT